MTDQISIPNAPEMLVCWGRWVRYGSEDVGAIGPDDLSTASFAIHASAQHQVDRLVRSMPLYRPAKRLLHWVYVAAGPIAEGPLFWQGLHLEYLDQLTKVLVWPWSPEPAYEPMCEAEGGNIALPTHSLRTHERIRVAAFRVGK